jgi:hypothetical protein
MKWIKYIWILIVIYIFCSARTCNENEKATEKQKEQYTMNLMNSVKNVFTSDSLSDHFLRAYEITAIEKLNDFADYMKVISDTTLDLRFRQKSAELVRNLFVSDKIILSKWSKNYPESGLYTLDKTIEYLLSEGTLAWIEPVDIRSIVPFALKNDSTWIGMLKCNLEYFSLSKKDTSKMPDRDIYVNIYLIKRVRYFGQEEIKVWQVYLGDIN